MIANPRPFVAVLLARSSSDAEGYQPLWEESVTLVFAESIDDAHRAARARGESAATRFRNDRGELIRWEFVRVVTVTEALDEDLGRPADLMSRTFRDLDAYEGLFAAE